MEGLPSSASQESTGFVKYQLQTEKEVADGGKLTGMGDAGQAQPHQPAQLQHVLAVFQ